MNRIGLTGVFLGIGAGAYAHHSGPPHYFMDEPQSLEGEVTELRLVNPHAYIYFDVTDETGAVANWRCELSAGVAGCHIGGRGGGGRLRATVRFEVGDDGETLVRAYTVHDPAFLQTDWVGESVMQLTGEPYEPYACTELSGENNRRSERE